MSFRPRAWAAALIGAALCLPAGAQIEASGLGDVDVWGASFLERGEAGFGNGLWTGSDVEYLLALTERIDVSALSQPERQLLSRVLRSPAKSPDGDLDELFLEARIKLLLELGERRAAATLADQAGSGIEGVDPDVILSDNRLARGEREVVCAQMNTSGDARFWSQLRAICALDAGEDAAAELAIEIAGQQASGDTWFGTAGFAMIAGQEDRPAARYGSGIQIALSELAGLEPDSDSISADRPDLAAMIARDESQPLELRLEAAAVAARAGMLAPEAHRDLYRTRLAGEDFEPSGPVEAAFAVLAKEPAPQDTPPAPAMPEDSEGPRDLRSMNETWIEPVRPDDLDPEDLEAEPVDEVSLAEEQALAVSEALRAAATSHAAFAARARLFETALDKIPAQADTDGHALLFATAAMETGNIELTDKWLDAARPDKMEDAGRFRLALLEGYAPVFGGERRDADPAGFVSVLLERGVEPAQQAAALKLFSVWAGFDMPVPAQARIALAQSDTGARGISSGMLAAIDAAERNGASGEALLSILVQTGGEPGALSGADLAGIFQTLRRMKAGKEARGLVLEAAGLWALIERSEPSGP